MAFHDVSFTVPKRPLGKVDVDFVVEKDGEVFGRLKISHGAAVWIPRNGRAQRKLSWTKLDQLFEDHGTRVR